MFVLGPAGTGKTQVIKTLNKTYQNQKRKPLLHDINPKAVTADELFGFINPATREWKDGKRCLESSTGKRKRWRLYSLHLQLNTEIAT